MRNNIFTKEAELLLKEIESEGNHSKGTLEVLRKVLMESAKNLDLELDGLKKGHDKMCNNNPYSAVGKMHREKPDLETNKGQYEFLTKLREEDLKEKSIDLESNPYLKKVVKERKEQELAEEKGYKSRNKDGGVKNDAKKPRMSLVPVLAHVETARVMTYGGEKYAAYNWMKGFDWTVLMDACERHLAAWKAGQDIDLESGFSHLGHALCCLMMLFDTTKLHPDRDDRSEEYKKYNQLINELMSMER